MRFTLRFAEKLHSQKDFQQILKSGRKLVHPALFIYVRPTAAGRPMSRMGLITGRKAFQKPMKEGVEILNLVQDVYLSKEITVA